MKLCGSVRSWLRVGLVGIAPLLLPVVASAQRDDGPGALPFALGAGMIVFFLLFGLAFYVYYALSLQTIAAKTNTENGWMAWIPIANVILMIMIARKPIWWIVLLLIPLVNIVIAIILWMGIAEARNKPNWWGILTIVPLVGIIVPGYLAWSD
jgi:hypothetical protein